MGLRSWLVAVALFTVVESAWAQDARMLRRFEQVFNEIKASHFETTGNLTLTEYGRLLYGAYTIGSYTYADGDTPAGRTTLTQVDARFWGQAEGAGHTLYGRLRLRYRWYGTGGDDGFVNPLGDRYWYRFDWRTNRRARTGTDPGWNWWAQVGRQYVNWVQGITLSQPLYAVRLGTQVGKFRVDGLLGSTPDAFVDFDPSRPGYNTDTDRRLWGIVAEYRGIPSHRPYVYYLDQDDQNDTVLPSGARYLYDSWYAAVGSTGQLVTAEWLYRVELIYEGGRSISDIAGTFPQTIDDIEAWAGRLYLAFMPYAQRFTRGLRFEFELLVGSGDPDRQTASGTVGGNLSGTKDTSFNAFGYVNTGLALAPDLANLVSVRLTASALPWKEHPLLGRLRLHVDGFLLMKMDADAPMSVATVPGQSFVGWEVDLTVAWQIANDAAFDLRYGVFFPGDAIPNDTIRQFLFVSFSYGF